jgi:hypothetical protein
MCTRIFIIGAGALVLVLVGIGLCFVQPRVPATDKWGVGYWIWGTWEDEKYRHSDSHAPVDLIVFDMGDLSMCRFGVRCKDTPSFYQFRSVEPAKLPEAKRYAAVVRMNESPFTKTNATVPVLKRYVRLQYRFQESQRILNELQIDFDCPTASLAQYADWLKQWRHQLPAGTRLTITALLDWFKPGTDIQKVLALVDGFVPQFYDVDAGNYQRIPQIAHFPDHKKWGPIFEQFKVPYQIGLSTFGRVQIIGNSYYFSQETPLNFLAYSIKAPQIHVNAVGERVLEMKLPKESCCEQQRPDSPANVVMIQPTRESILRSFQEAQSMGAYCTGVLFFRWPSIDESLVMKPKEIAAILDGKLPDDGFSLESSDAACALVNCCDLSLIQHNRFSGRNWTIEIESSAPMEYFLPNRLLKPAMIHRRKVHFRIPAYNAAEKIYLGRAVSQEDAKYSVRMLP